MVFIHELGHFVAAKLNGVDVESLLPRLGSAAGRLHARGDLVPDFLVSRRRLLQDEGRAGPRHRGGGANAARSSRSAECRRLRGAAEGWLRRAAQGSFLAASPWRRIVIAVFGPLFNLVFALLVFTVIWWAGFRVYSTDNRIILASDYTLVPFARALPAAAAGLKTGDRITAIDGAPVEKFQDILEAVTVAPGKTLRSRSSDAGRRGQHADPPDHPRAGQEYRGGTDRSLRLGGPGRRHGAPGERRRHCRPASRRHASWRSTGSPSSTASTSTRLSRPGPRSSRVTYERGGVRTRLDARVRVRRQGHARTSGWGSRSHLFHSPRLGPVGALGEERCRRRGAPSR